MRTVLPLVFLLAACNNPCKPGGGEPEVEIGWGETEFNPNTGTVELIHGPQGGYHLPVAFRAMYFDASEIIGGTLTGSIGGVQLGTSSPWLTMTCESGALESFNALLIFEAPPEDLVNQTCTVNAELQDLDLRTASAEVEVRIIDTVDENPE